MKRRSFQIKAKRRAGCCFRLAWVGLMRSKEPLVMVHGEVNGPDNTRIPHAWLVGPDFYYDAVADRFFTMGEYLSRLAAEVRHVYTKDEAAVMVFATGHYGPWK